jgi:hypothetical protein
MVSLVHAAISGNGTSSTSPKELLAQSVVSKPNVLQHSISWIGDRSKATPNRSWPIDFDEDSRVVFVQAPAEKHESPAPGPFSGLAEQVRAAKGSFRPVSEADLSAAISDVKTEVARVAWLLSDTSEAAKPANDRWKEILKWDQLQAVIAPNAKSDPDEVQKIDDAIRDAQSSDALDRAAGEKEIPQNSLDLRSALNDVHVALQRYRLLLIAAGPKGHADFDTLIDELAKSISADPASWSSNAGPSPGELLGKLQAEGRAPQLVAEIRRYFAQPNLMIQAPQEFISRISGGAIEVQPNDHFTDNILDTNIVGKTHPRDDLKKTVTLVPNNDHAVLGVRFTGTVDSDTVGYHPPVTITSHGTTELVGTTQVTIDGDGFASAPWCSSACTHTCIECIAVCGGRLVQRIATRKVYQKKPEAECIAGQHAQRLLAEQLESNSKEALGKSNDNFKARMRDPLASWGAYPRLHYATTATALTIQAVEQNDFQLSAPTEAPPVTGNPFLAMRVHESFINNLLAASLGGRTVSQAQFEGGVGNFLGPNAAAKTRMGGESAEQIKEKEAKMTDVERENYRNELKRKREFRKITFAEQNPVTVLFTDQGFSITIRGTRFEGEDLDRPALDEDITAHYKFEPADAPTRAVRTGPLDIAPPASRKISGGEGIARRKFEERKLRDRFNELLPETIKFEGLDFSESDDPWNKIGALKAERVHSGDGWLSIDWQQASP